MHVLLDAVQVNLDKALLKRVVSDDAQRIHRGITAHLEFICVLGLLPVDDFLKMVRACQRQDARTFGG